MIDGRGTDDDEFRRRLGEGIPSLEALHQSLAWLSPDLVSLEVDPMSRLPVAAGCFRDAIDVLGDVKYALVEAKYHLISRREQSKPPDRHGAVFYGRFYADDAALRLYAVGEHAANGIVELVDIQAEDLRGSRRHSESFQSAVGRFLLRARPSDRVTAIVSELLAAEEWRDTIAYRNRWVHQQPPTMDESGFVFRRGRRWRPLEGGGFVIDIGTGDEPETTVDRLIGTVCGGGVAVERLLTKLVAELRTRLDISARRLRVVDRSSA